jgi:hypothetical protein
MLLRVRVTSFLAGFGLASAAAFWQLRNDITTSSQFLAAQVRGAPRMGVLRARAAPARRPARCCIARRLARCSQHRAKGGNPNTTHPQAQEARDALERRVSALEAAMQPCQPAPAAPPADAGLSSIEELAEVLTAAASAEVD